MGSYETRGQTAGAAQLHGQEFTGNLVNLATIVGKTLLEDAMLEKKVCSNEQEGCRVYAKDPPNVEDISISIDSASLGGARWSRVKWPHCGHTQLNVWFLVQTPFSAKLTYWALWKTMRTGFAEKVDKPAVFAGSISTPAKCCQRSMEEAVISAAIALTSTLP